MLSVVSDCVSVRVSSVCSSVCSLCARPGAPSKERHVLREGAAQAEIVGAENGAQKLRSAHALGHCFAAQAQRELLLDRAGQHLQM